MAVAKDVLEIFHKMWEWAKEVLAPEQLNNNMFFAKDKIERTAWHVASHSGKLGILYKLWEWAN